LVAGANLSESSAASLLSCTANDVPTSRIPYPSLDTLSPIKQARVADTTRRLLNVSWMAFHASDGLWSAQAALGRATIDADLDKRVREMVILRVAYLQRSDYELFHHRELARNLGVDEATLAVVLSDDLSSLAPSDRALIDFVGAVTLDATPSDTVLAEMRQFFSDRIVFDVVVVIGSYMLTARLAAVGGVAIETEAVTGW
jgi:4-carboxymuconolactone decarboxylase